MPTYGTWTDPAPAGSLTGRLEQLYDRLSQLSAVLRDGIARAVGSTAGETARAAVRRLLARLPGCGPPAPRPSAWANDDEGDDWDTPRSDAWGPGDEFDAHVASRPETAGAGPP